MRWSIATLVLAFALAGVASPAAARRKVTVRMTVHLKSHYLRSIDYTDDTDPECVSTSRGMNEVVADMPNDRPSVYRIK